MYEKLKICYAMLIALAHISDVRGVWTHNYDFGVGFDCIERKIDGFWGWKQNKESRKFCGYLPFFLFSLLWLGLWFIFFLILF